MGNLCGGDTVLQTSVSGALLGHSSDVFDFKYGVDVYHPVVQHDHGLGFINDLALRDRLSPIIQRLQQQKKLYKDPDYLTVPLVLKSQQQTKNCKWVRPGKFIGTQEGRYTIFRDTKPDAILVNDEVVQYFGIFLILMSKNPQLIDQTICLKENTYGLNVIRVFLHGTQRHVLIDDEILCDDRSSPIFTPHERNQAWPLLLEKCWMKIIGPIEQMGLLRAEQPIWEILGIPSQLVSLNSTSVAEISNLLCNKIHQKQFVYFTSKLNPNKKVGLSGRKHFALLAHFNLDGVNYFLMRNPLGKFEFRGSYAEPNEQLMQSLRILKIHDLKPGNFIVDAQEIIEQFESYTICHYQPSYKLNCLQFLCRQNAQFFIRFTLSRPGPICLRLHQISRYHSSQQRFAPFMIDLIDVQNMKLVADGSQMSFWGAKNIDFFDEVLHHLNAGTYIARLKPKWSATNNQIEMAMLAYFYADVDIRFEKEDQERYKQYFQNYLKTEGELALQQQRKIHGQIAYQIKWQKNRVIIFVKNVSKRRRGMKLELDFPALQNLQCVSHDITNARGVTVDLEDSVTVVFQKVSLTEETAIREYFINPY